MLFKNILKLSVALFLASSSLAADFQGDCDKLNKELIENVKKNLREIEEIEDHQPLKECSVNKNGEIEEMYLISERLDENFVEKALSHKKIKKITYFLDNDFYQRDPADYDDFPTAINKLPELEELTLKYYEEVFDHGDYIHVEHVINASIFNLVSKKIKTITLDHISIDEDVIEQLGKLEHLEKLIVISGDYNRVFTSNYRNYNLLIKLKNIDNIILDDKVVNVHHKYSGECQKMDDYLYPNVLENIQPKDNKDVIIPLRECILDSNGEVSELYFVNQRNDKELIEKALSHNSIKKLTFLLDNIHINNEKATYDDFPTIINQLSNLEELTLRYDHKTYYKGGEDYYYDEKIINPDILKTSSKKLKILTLHHISFTDELVKRIGEISSLEQLIVYTGDDGSYVSISSKDEVKLAEILRNPKFEITIDGYPEIIGGIPMSTNGKCGEDDGYCPNGECCSKYGYCGKSDAHCGKGCQSEFGECKTTTTTTIEPLPTSTNDRCGKDYGVCPSGKCCSKYGYCGKSDDYCGKGCQSEFGKCKTTTTTTIEPLPTSTNDRCGKEYGVCPSGKCCSKYGYCGKSDDHCGKGCQSEFGKCKTTTTITTTTTKKPLPTSTNGKCGKDYGVCPSGKCCSKYGYCGKSEDHCGKGCQSEFGKCN